MSWDEREDLNDNYYKITSCVGSAFTGKPVCNYYLAWKVDNGNSVKYFRVFRNEKFIGVVNTYVYVDKHVEVTPDLKYTV